MPEGVDHEGRDDALSEALVSGWDVDGDGRAGFGMEWVPPRPATRVGRELIFEGGECRRMGLVEYFLVKFGIKRMVARAARKGA